jgi:hypothetical protein
MAFNLMTWQSRRPVHTIPPRPPLVEIQVLDVGFGAEIAQYRKSQ